jgi:hypothetical protein
MSAITEFLQALRADLLDRRMLAVLSAGAVLLLAAIAYVVLGSESAPTPVTPIAPATASSAASGTTGIAVSQVAKGSTGAVAEVTSGESLQHGGPTRDPLAAPAGDVAGTSSNKTASVSGTSSPSSTGGSGAASAPAATSPATTSPSKASPTKTSPAKTSPTKTSPAKTSPAKTSPTKTSPATEPRATTPQKAPSGHSVDVLFGLVPAGTTTLVEDLTPYGNLRTVTPFPSAAENLIELVAVSASADAARFRFIQPMIPSGVAKCIPSPTHCEAIDLKPGTFEQLEYAPPSGGPTLLYQLELVKIT